MIKLKIHTFIIMALLLIVITSQTHAEFCSGVEFPNGISSFADEVVSYEPFFGGGPPSTGVWSDPNLAIGLCDSKHEGGSVAIGRGGRITLKFTDNALTGSDNSNPDLQVFETGKGEGIFVEISKDGNNFISVGYVFGSGSIDIDVFGFDSSDKFFFVRLTDDPDDGAPVGGVYEGADLDAVGAISSTKPTACQLYGVHDEGLNNTQFFTISSETFEVKALGDMRKAHDIEALDIHPQTTELFVASGKDTQIKGHLYQLNAQTGALTSIGSTGFKEIDGLSFHPEGTLWGWATGDGLVTIDTTTGKSSLVAAYSGEVEDLTWNNAGTILYGVGNIVDGSSDTGTRLLSYDGTTLTTVCEELTQSLEIEALDTLPDDTLIFGLHGKNSLPLGVIDVQTCKIVAEQEISTSYNDVEGIAWPNCQ